MRASFQTPGFHGYSVKFSPFNAKSLAVAVSQNFGLAGKGAVFILNHSLPEGPPLLSNERILDWPNDALYDITWSETHDHILWSGSADGHIQIWDLAITPPTMPSVPRQCIKAHEKEIYSIEWNQVRTDPPSVLTASWDSAIKLWDALSGQEVKAFVAHDGICYSAVWSPIQPGTFTSTSADGTIKLWSVMSPNPLLLTIPKPLTNSLAPGAQFEILACDWNKYDINMLASASTDGVIRVHDLRNPSTPLIILDGHRRAVRRVKYSPHSPNILASCSYDFTSRLWDTLHPKNNMDPLLITMSHHREFVYGLDFNVHIPELLADCGWDQMVHVFKCPP